MDNWGVIEGIWYGTTVTIETRVKCRVCYVASSVLMQFFCIQYIQLRLVSPLIGRKVYCNLIAPFHYTLTSLYTDMAQLQYCLFVIAAK